MQHVVVHNVSKITVSNAYTVHTLFSSPHVRNVAQSTLLQQHHRHDRYYDNGGMMVSNISICIVQSVLLMRTIRNPQPHQCHGLWRNRH